MLATAAGQHNVPDANGQLTDDTGALLGMEEYNEYNQEGYYDPETGEILLTWAY